MNNHTGRQTDHKILAPRQKDRVEQLTFKFCFVTETLQCYCTLSYLIIITLTAVWSLLSKISPLTQGDCWGTLRGEASCTVCQENEGNALSQQMHLGAALPTLAQGHTNRDSFSIVLPSTRTPWALWGAQPVVQLIPPCIPSSKILVMSAAVNILGSVEMNRKWCIDLLDAFSYSKNILLNARCNALRKKKIA